MTNSNAYLRTRVLSASPAELRLMLFDGAIRFLSQGLDSLDVPEYEGAYDGYSKCQAIIVELLNALDPSQAPELCERLGALYSFMYSHLVDSLTEKDPAKGREVLSLLEYERETWRQVMEKLVAEGMELKVPAPSAAAPMINPADTAAHVAGGERPTETVSAGVSATSPRRAAPGGYGKATGGSSLSVRG